MYSLSKTPVTQQTAQDIVFACFGSDAGISSFSELVDGYFNAAYKIVLADGLACVLKVAPPAEVRVLRYEHDLMRAEVAALRLARAHTEMPAPDVLFDDNSGSIIASHYFLMDFMPGTPYNQIKKSLSGEEQRSIERGAGRLLRQFNEIGGPSFGYLAHPDSEGCTWRTVFRGMMAGVLADGVDRQVNLPLPYEQLAQGLARHYDVLQEIVLPRLVHWDLWDGNILVDGDPKRVTGVIDFERSLWGDPLMEVNFGGLTVSEAFLEGYGLSMLQTDAQQRRKSLYKVYLYLIMVIECYYRQYESDHQEKWARPRLEAELRNLGILPAE
jgi:aminoglycoside phosphotransferase (APT) family kinase protein